MGMAFVCVLCVFVSTTKWACCPCFGGLLMHNFRAQLEPAALIRLSFWTTRSARPVSSHFSVYKTNWDTTEHTLKTKSADFRLSSFLTVLHRLHCSSSTLICHLAVSQVVRVRDKQSKGNKSAIYMLKWLYDVAGMVECRRKARRKVQKKPQKRKQKGEQEESEKNEFLLICDRD